MPGLEDLGKMLLLMGGLIALIGLILILVPKVPLLGRLPGDIVIQHEGFSCFFPLATMLLVSLVLTILLNIIVRLLGR